MVSVSTSVARNLHPFILAASKGYTHDAPVPADTRTVEYRVIVNLCVNTHPSIFDDPVVLMYNYALYVLNGLLYVHVGAHPRFLARELQAPIWTLIRDTTVQSNDTLHYINMGSNV